MASPETSPRLNAVLLNSDQISAVEYVKDSLHITPGQPANPPPAINQNGQTWTINMNCGRSGSSPIAKEFVQASAGPPHVFCPSAVLDPTPSELNFFFAVNVTFAAGNQTVTLQLGQGHQFAQNNWWIGGQQVSVNNLPSPDRAGLLAIGEVTYKITGDPNNNNVNVFNFTEES